VQASGGFGTADPRGRVRVAGGQRRVGKRISAGRDSSAERPQATPSPHPSEYNRREDGLQGGETDVRLRPATTVPRRPGRQASEVAGDWSLWRRSAVLHGIGSIFGAG
jgi:hypothetical protein